jgi:hypothetical protein
MTAHRGARREDTFCGVPVRTLVLGHHFGVVCAAVGGAVGLSCGPAWWGVVGVLLGAALGGALADFLVEVLVPALKYYLAAVWRRARPPLPVCGRGVCRGGDYQWLTTSEEGTVYRCRCGDFYVRTDRSFDALHPDQSVHPFMTRGGLRGWRPAARD